MSFRPATATRFTDHDYAQRASARLIIAEAATPSAVGQAHPTIPALYRQAQVAGWRRVTDAVHDANGYRIHQFLAMNTNHRKDSYGGEVAHRIRFALDVVHAVAEAIGPCSKCSKPCRLQPDMRREGLTPF